MRAIKTAGGCEASLKIRNKETPKKAFYGNKKNRLIFINRVSVVLFCYF